MSSTLPTEVDVAIIGGGQSGLAVGYQLRRHIRRPGNQRPSFVILDDHPQPGGAWQDMWGTLHLFSPAGFSSLPGWPMPPWSGEDNPDTAHVVKYLAAYEERYELPVERPVTVTAVRRTADEGRLLVETDEARTWSARWVVNTTGTWRRPFWPNVPGMADFAGRQLHTVSYSGAAAFAGRRVLVVGGGNSGAQIAADLLPVAASVTWATKHPPRMLPDDVDGRILFETATRAVEDRVAGIANDGVASLGDIVAVPSVRHARDHHGLHAEPMFEHLVAGGAVWADGKERPYDAVIWCTGFRPALRHLAPLALSTRQGRPRTTGFAQLDVGSTRHRSPVVSVNDPRVLFVGYGDWCGPASATLIGVNRAARDAAATVLAERVASEPAGGSIVTDPPALKVGWSGPRAGLRG
ncbi:MAG TPA: ArsO family NAD(P)H-dependent flavin-containing monooxygenase [Actinomycetes bacterium]|nr:ArsO family NAD(P)H-dependent flavin-containing monooxygenase [Actinomycetes bacterium]